MLEWVNRLESLREHIQEFMNLRNRAKSWESKVLCSIKRVLCNGNPRSISDLHWHFPYQVKQGPQLYLAVYLVIWGSKELSGSLGYFTSGVSSFHIAFCNILYCISHISKAIRLSGCHSDFLSCHIGNSRIGNFLKLLFYMCNRSVTKIFFRGFLLLDTIECYIYIYIFISKKMENVI